MRSDAVGIGAAIVGGTLRRSQSDSALWRPDAKTVVRGSGTHSVSMSEIYKAVPGPMKRALALCLPRLAHRQYELLRETQNVSSMVSLTDEEIGESTSSGSDSAGSVIRAELTGSPVDVNYYSPTVMGFGQPIIIRPVQNIKSKSVSDEEEISLRHESTSGSSAASVSDEEEISLRHESTSGSSVASVSDEGGIALRHESTSGSSAASLSINTKTSRRNKSKIRIKIQKVGGEQLINFEDCARYNIGILMSGKQYYVRSLPHTREASPIVQRHVRTLQEDGRVPNEIVESAKTFRNVTKNNKSNYLRAWREHRGYSADKAAELSGISGKRYHVLEADPSQMMPDERARIANVFNISLDKLCLAI